MTTYAFPKPTRLRCSMMPVVQGDPDSLPEGFEPYRDFIERFTLNPGEPGRFTVDERHVEAGATQRGFGKCERPLHREVGFDGGSTKRGRWHGPQAATWGAPVPTPHWGPHGRATLSLDAEVLIASNIDGTCMVWEDEDYTPSEDGDLGHRAHLYPYEKGRTLAAGEVARLSIFQPHESLTQGAAGMRQFVRLVGQTVKGREFYWTRNPKIPEFEAEEVPR